MKKPPNWHNEDGFEFALYPAKSGKAKSLVIVLHGHGSNTQNWDVHARQLQDEMPDCDIINLQGPRRLPDNPDGSEGYTWTAYQGSVFSVFKQSLRLVFNHLPVVDKLDSFIDKQLAKRGLTEDDLGLFGNSMGGIVVLQTALNRRKPVAGVVSHSSALLPFTKVKSKPDILLIMGQKDEVFHKPEAKPKGLKKIFNAIARRFSVQHNHTLRRLRKRHINFTEKLFPDLTHAVTQDSIHEGAQFLVKALKRRKGS
ncbi:MAG: hypothetical protein EPN97_01425 [Alphaproteobacteria bacterium]|nr:MAG: hypothetical protein EPN97_01425 [Alphaproteobacteria bacterium]